MNTSLPKELLYPKHWATWFGAGILFLIVKLLPYRVLMRLGGGFGRLMEKLMPYRFLISKTNIELCFSEDEAARIYREHVKSVGKGFLEMAMGWFLSPTHFAKRTIHVGYEDADKALAEGRGVLLLGMHTTGMDFGLPLLNSRYSAHFMYQDGKSAVLNYILTWSRLRNCTGLIERHNVRELMSRLKNSEIVWYGCDQDYGNNAKSVFAPFFHMPSAYTLPYYAKIAKKTGAAVIPVAGFRDEKSGKFVVRYLPEIPVVNMSEEQAATAMNEAIAKLLDGYEDQYYWVHRRFKTRPEGEPSLYPPKPSALRREKIQAKKDAQAQQNKKDK